MSADFVNLPHMTPVHCPFCQAKASLAKRNTDNYVGGPPEEIWIFVCEQCRSEFGRVVEK
jgi:hypothetical protein